MRADVFHKLMHCINRSSEKQFGYYRKNFTRAQNSFTLFFIIKKFRVSDFLLLSISVQGCLWVQIRFCCPSNNFSMRVFMPAIYMLVSQLANVAPIEAVILFHIYYGTLSVEICNKKIWSKKHCDQYQFCKALLVQIEISRELPWSLAFRCHNKHLLRFYHHVSLV